MTRNSYKQTDKADIQVDTSSFRKLAETTQLKLSSNDKNTTKHQLPVINRLSSPRKIKNSPENNFNNNGYQSLRLTFSPCCKYTNQNLEKVESNKNISNHQIMMLELHLQT